MGVILFAILCGRLPFEGPDLIGTKRPREQIIKSRIMKSQYKIDDNLGPEAKDLVRRMLQIDPVERASIPEIFNHVWVRPAVSGNVSDQFHLQSLAAANANANANASLVTKSNPEAGNIYSGAGAAAIARRNSGATLPIFREDPSSPQLERGESIPPRVGFLRFQLRFTTFFFISKHSLVFLLRAGESSSHQPKHERHPHGRDPEQRRRHSIALQL
jgi:serine/threonine protein kinase